MLCALTALVDLTKRKASSETINWNKELNLLLADKQCIESGGLLNDNIITAAQLHKSTPS